MSTFPLLGRTKSSPAVFTASCYGTIRQPAARWDRCSPALSSPPGRQPRWPTAGGRVRPDGEAGDLGPGNGQQLAQFPDVPASASIAWSPAGDLLATALGPSTELWDRPNPRHPKLAATVPNAHGSARPDYLLFSPDGRLLVTAAAEDNV